MRKMATFLALPLLVLLCCGVGQARAYDFPQPVGYVNDFAHMLSPAKITSLDDQLAAFEKATTTQVVLVTVNSLDGADIKDYSNNLFRTWKIGQKDKDNGVLILMVREGFHDRIEVGRGLEGVLTDANCKYILHYLVRPEFHAGHFDAAATIAITKVIETTKGEFKAPDSDDSSGGHSDLAVSFSKLPWWGKIIVVVIVIILVIIAILFIALLSDGDTSSGGGGYYSGGYGGDSSGSNGGGGFSGGGGTSGGGGADD